MSRLWPIASMLAGFALMAGSVVAPNLAPTAGAWTDADQQALTQAFSEWHHASHAHEHGASGAASGTPHAASHVDQASAARTAYEEQQAKLRSAQTRGWWLTWGLRLSGVLLAAAGIGGWLRGRMS